MNFKKIIPALGLPALLSPDCQASTLASLRDLYYFDASSLFWMLIGVALGVYLHSRFSREKASPMRMPTLQVPVGPMAAERREMRPDQNPVCEAAAHSMQYWMDLEEATTVMVEELSSVEEEAEVFLMMGRTDMAIKVLRDRLDVEPGKASVWFKLLDIYHVQGMRAPFELLAQEIKTRFNVALPTWDASRLEAESRHGLEHFPSLLTRITRCWNDPSGQEYLKELMQDNRKGARMGFNEEAFRDMLFLSQVLEARMKESAANRPDV